MRSALCLGFACLVATGCSAGSANGDLASWPGPAQALLGGGVFEFEPASTCEQMGIIHGSQGGYHVWGSVRARYLDPASPVMHFIVSDVDTGHVLNAFDQIDTSLHPLDSTRLMVIPRPATGTPQCADGGTLPDPDAELGLSGVPDGTDGWAEVIGLRMYLPQSWNGCLILRCINNRRLLFHVDVTDSQHRTASDERQVVPRMDPSDATDSEALCDGDADAGIAGIDLAGFPCH